MTVLPIILVAASLVLAQAPTDPPSNQTGRLPALGYPILHCCRNPQAYAYSQMEYLECLRL